MEYGTTIERGRAVRQTEDGKWTVESIDRDGVNTLPLSALSAIEAGDIVLFCEFADGEGIIFGRLKAAEE